MFVTHVSVRPTPAADEVGRPALTPELMASVGARYSRTNEGLESILSRIDFGNEASVYEEIAQILSQNHEDGANMAEVVWSLQDMLANLRKPQLEKGVKAILDMVDYGHASIGDMVPVSMFMDGVSIFLAYYIWSISPLAGGQESSTRYIKMNVSGLLHPGDDLGLPESKWDDYYNHGNNAFDHYKSALALWEDVVEDHPEAVRIPESWRGDPNKEKAIERIKRNFPFDRARVFLPVTAATNVMMVQSAREWVSLSSHLQSHPLPECRKLGRLIASELQLVAPNMTRHAKPSLETESLLADEFNMLRKDALNTLNHTFSPLEHGTRYSVEPYALVEVCCPPSGAVHDDYVSGLTHRRNRYSLIGSSLSRTMIRYGWKAVSFGEIRDLNRHRTGTKYCPLVPLGFYAALDQMPGTSLDLQELEGWGGVGSLAAREQLAAGDPFYIYTTLLGTQYYFEHATTANKFIYTAELRTGDGAHYRYGKHFHDALTEFYRAFPDAQKYVIEGRGEPE